MVSFALAVRESVKVIRRTALIFLMAVPSFSAFGAIDCVPEFPYQSGWLGGDAVYSISLGKNRMVWLFGDSFVRRDNVVSRSGSKMVSNSIAISQCESSKWQITYHWNKQGTDTSEPFFPPIKGADKLWPKDGLLYKGSLYIFLDKIQNTSSGLGFRGVGTVLARIANPNDEPSRWKISYLPVTDSQVLFPGVSINVRDTYLYIFSVLDGESFKNHPIILLRLSLDHLDEPAKFIEFYSKNGEWTTGVDWAKAKIIIPEGHTEMSVRYHPGLRKWIAFQITPGFPARSVALRMSPSLEGPWSKLQTMYEFPEMSRETSGFDKDTHCYAVKEHIDFLNDESLVTYACNSLVFKKLVDNLALYSPRLVRVSISRINEGENDQ